MFKNLDLLAVGIAVAAIGILGAIVFFSNRKSTTNRSFLFFSAVVILWSLSNYASYQFSDKLIILWVLRLSIFFAVWYSFGLYQLFLVFPNNTFVFSRNFKFFILPSVVLTSFLTLTPAVFPSIKSLGTVGQVSTVVPGPGIFVFGAVVISLIGGAIISLLKNIKKAAPQQKTQFILVFWGTAITFFLHICFNFIFPVLLDITRFIPLGALFVLPFILFTSFSIIRYHLLDIKIIATEVLTFVLSVLTFLEVLISNSISEFIGRVAIFALVLVFGIFLIRSVRKEVEQREKLEVISRELQKANIRLKEIDQQKTDFLSIAAHQLRTPLSILNGYIELIKDGAYGKVHIKTKEILDNMDASNQHLIKLVDEFLDISRLDQGRTKYDFKENDIVELIDGVEKEQSVRVEKKGLKLHWVKPKLPIKAVFDDEKVRHVIYNFVDNAAKYSEHGTITTTVELEDGGIAVRVKDHGFGFDKVDEANFFQKFYRGNNVKNKDVSGTGLGLYVCSKFIDGHKGKIWAHSEGLGKGSEFGFWIPQKNISSK